MKTLYININNEQIQSNEELEVLKHDLDSDFFFYLGEKIAKGCNIENENALITDFNTKDHEEDYRQIIVQWNELKGILFSDGCEGKFEFTIPSGYIHWLRYNEKYNHVYDKNFSHGEPPVIYIDLKELYEESVEDLQRKILRKLQRDDLYLEIDEIVFNDDAVTRKSPIVRTIKEKYESVGFKAYKKWLDENKQIEDNNILGTGNPKDPINNLLPLYNITLGETTYFEIREKLGLEDFPTTYIPVPGIEFNIGGPFRKSHAYISITLKKIPTEWICKGIKPELSCKNMTDIFVGFGFKYLPIEDIEYLEVLENESVNELHFVTPDNRYSVYVEYKYDRFDLINITYLNQE